MKKSFDYPIDIAVYGHTHMPGIESYPDVVIINPSSACMPNHQMNELGTVGILEIINVIAEVRILQLDPFNGFGKVVHQAYFQKKNSKSPPQ